MPASRCSRDADAELGLQVFIDVLQPLALADRIEDQHHVALPGQPLGEALIRLDRLAGRRMAAAADDARQREFARGRFVRHVEIRRDGKAGAAFEDDLFDAIRIALDRAGDSGVQRRPLRLRAEGLGNSLLHRADVGFGIGLGFQSREPLFVLGFGGLDLIDEPLLHHPREAVERL